VSGEEQRLDNPFPGPQPYRAADRHRFHGRDAVGRELTSIILAHRSVALFGPSGAGKSSLMQAAVLPTLIDEHDFRVVAVDGWPSGEAPVAWLLEVLLRDLKLTSPTEPLSVFESVEWIVELAFYRSDRPVLIVLDQLEQLLFVQRNVEEVADFLDWLDRFAGQPFRGLHLVLAMREDYLGRFRDRARGRHRLLEHGFRLGPLTVGEMTGAVTQAAASGEPPQTWSSAATRRLMLQVRVPGQSEQDNAEVQTAFAQIVCRALFAQRASSGEAQSDGAPVEAEPILQSYLEGALAALGKLRAPAERLLEDHLIAADGTRTLLTEEAAGAAGLVDDEGLYTILTDLELAAILRAEQHRGTRYFELGHDWLAKRVFDGKQERIARIEEDARERERLAEQQATELALERARAETQRARKVIAIVALCGLIAVALGVAAWMQRLAAVEARSESDLRRHEAEQARQSAEEAQTLAESAQRAAEVARTQAEQAKTRVEKSDKENERSVRQMYEVALRPLTERLITKKQSIGVFDIDERWTPLLARGEQVSVAASLGESFRAVVAGHEFVISETNQEGRSLFLEITMPWLLADQARRTIAIVPHQPEKYRRLDVLQRNLLRLSYEVEVVASLASDDLLTEVGVLIIDNRSAPDFSADELAVLTRFVQRGGGVLAVGRGQEWLDRPSADGAPAPTIDNYPMNTIFASLGATWSAVETSPEQLAQRDIPAVVRFENKLMEDVNLYTGAADREQYYTTLAPQEVSELLTLVGSRWVFRGAADDREIGAVKIDDESQTVRIGATVAKAKRSTKIKPKPPEEPKTVRKRADQTPEKLTSEDMKPARGEAKQAAKSCGAKLNTLMSEVSVTLTVGKDGKVASVVALPPAKGTPEANCVVTAVSKLELPRSKTGGKATWKLKLY